MSHRAIFRRTFAEVCSSGRCRYQRSGGRVLTAYFSTPKKDKPKPFLNSDAHKHRVLDEYVLTPEEQRKGRFGIPIGLSLFAFIIYMGWIRKENPKYVEFLTTDISDKIPPTAYKKMKQGLEESEKIQNGKGTS